MPRNVQLSAADKAKILRLKAQNVKISDIAKQIKRSRIRIYAIFSKNDNAIAKRFKSIKKNISEIERFYEQFQPIECVFVKL